MATIVITALLLSLVIYILIGFRHSRKVFSVGDIMPMMKGKNAQVRGDGEFSASSVATSLSLATVIVAFFDLVPGLGLWLLWPGLTTALGFLLFSLLSRRIWEKMTVYEHRPSLHEFIGTEFGSKKIAFVASLFTTIGYLSAFAIELTVGARFLAGLIPEIPQWITVVIISLVGFTYTSLGGFRTVVVTDRIQMWIIWLMLIALIIFYGIYGETILGGIGNVWERIPANGKSFQWSDTLIPFIVGIFIMNLFTYVSNMALWQRIAGAQDPGTIIRGLRKSVYQSLISWALFAAIAIGAFIIVTPIEGQNFLITLLNEVINIPGGKIIVFIVTLGLYAAMLSTASTQLIAVTHTVYEDIIAPFRKTTLADRMQSRKELLFSRLILVFSALAAIVVVEALRVGGFSVADLAFSVYGAALSLVPAILFSLFVRRSRLKHLSIWGSVSVVAGFSAAWILAIYGKIIGDGNLVFLAPVSGIAISGGVLLTGWFVTKTVTAQS